MADAADTIESLRARLDAPDAGIAFPMYWRGDKIPPLPDTAAPFAYLTFNSEGSGGGPIATGGGRGNNLYRNRASLEAFVFSPRFAGEAVVLRQAETIAARLRSYRNQILSCWAADVLPIGEGSKVAPPGLNSPVSNYQCALAAIELHFDQIG